METFCPPLQYSRTRIQYFETISNNLHFDFQFLEFWHDSRNFLIRPEFIQSGFKCVSRFCMHNFIRQTVMAVNTAETGTATSRTSRPINIFIKFKVLNDKL